MAKILYIKFNSERRPESRISTSIIEKNGQKYALKRPMTPAARAHIDRMPENYGLLREAYDGPVPVSAEKDGDGVRFPFVTGRPLITEEEILEEISAHPGERPQDVVISLVRKLLGKVLSYRTPLSDFQISGEFQRVFPSFRERKEKKEKSFPLINIDSNFDNFLYAGDSLVCIDYEWVFRFPVPVDYVRFRTCLYFYNKHEAFLRSLFMQEEFLGALGFDAEDRALYLKMEDNFQFYVHGQDRRYLYLTNMRKREHFVVDEASSLQAQVKEQARVIEEQRKTIDLLNEMNRLFKERVKKSLKNPAYGLYEVGKKVTKKAAGKAAGKFDSAAKVIKHLSALTGGEDTVYDEYIRKKEAKENEALAAVLAAVDGGSSDAVSGAAATALSGTATASADTGTAASPVSSTEATSAGIPAQEAAGLRKAMVSGPKISVLMPVYNVTDPILTEAIESVRDQIYKNWELVLVDDCSPMKNVRPLLRKFHGIDPRIKVIFRRENGGISRCTDTALRHAEGEYAAFMDCDDTISPDALLRMAGNVMEEPSVDFLYSDEDKLSPDGKVRSFPFFKPDWSPDTYLSLNYTSHLSVYRTEISKKIGGLRTGFEGSQDYDFTLRFLDWIGWDARRIAHIPHILYHWRKRKESTASSPDAKPYILEAAKKAKEESAARFLSRENPWHLAADVALIKEVYQFRVNYHFTEKEPLVSVIVPSKDNYPILERCLHSLAEITAYKNYEIIVVDNGSSPETREKVKTLLEEFPGSQYLCQKMVFNFSKMCNIGVLASHGDLLLFLNDDIEVTVPDWMGAMAGQACLPRAGAVGAKLLYPGPEKKIQHDGIINLHAGPSHVLGTYPDTVLYDFCRNRVDYNYLAVTGACLMVDRKKFFEVGGFDEERLPIAYNDVDLCYKLYEAGYYNVVRNDAVLLHYESYSRGDDRVDEAKMRRLIRDRETLNALHPEIGQSDPFYNPNLTQRATDFSVDLQAGL